MRKIGIFTILLYNSDKIYTNWNKNARKSDKWKVYRTVTSLYSKNE